MCRVIHVLRWRIGIGMGVAFMEAIWYGKSNDNDNTTIESLSDMGYDDDIHFQLGQMIIDNPNLDPAEFMNALLEWDAHEQQGGKRRASTKKRTKRRRATRKRRIRK
jgi:hypothetical protein